MKNQKTVNTKACKDDIESLTIRRQEMKPTKKSTAKRLDDIERKLEGLEFWKVINTDSEVQERQKLIKELDRLKSDVTKELNDLESDVMRELNRLRSAIDAQARSARDAHEKISAIASYLKVRVFSTPTSWAAERLKRRWWCKICTNCPLRCAPAPAGQ